MIKQTMTAPAILSVKVVPRARQAGLGGYLLSSPIHSFGSNIIMEDRVEGDASKGSRIRLELKKAEINGL